MINKPVPPPLFPLHNFKLNKLYPSVLQYIMKLTLALINEITLIKKIRKLYTYPVAEYPPPPPLHTALLHNSQHTNLELDEVN